MSTISTQLRNFKDPTKDELTELFFSIPDPQPSDVLGNSAAPNEKGSTQRAGAADQVERMEINATLSMGPELEEESYVSRLPSTRALLWEHHADDWHRQESCTSSRRTSPSRRTTASPSALRSHCRPSGASSA